MATKKEPLQRQLSESRLSSAEIDEIEQRYRQARASGDIGALAILAVEAFPSLISSARERK